MAGVVPERADFNMGSARTYVQQAEQELLHVASVIERLYLVELQVILATRRPFRGCDR